MMTTVRPPARWVGLVSRLARSLIVALLMAPRLGAAQPYAAGEPVVIPGIELQGWGQVTEVEGHFGHPAANATKTAAILILHGSGGVDGRGAYYAKALQEAGFATLEVTMFAPGGRPRAGIKATMPFAAAALKWLGTRPDVDASKLGVMGFSWGGTMTVLMSSEMVQEFLGKDAPRPAAFAPLYPTCSNIVRIVQRRENAFYGAERRMSASPMLIQVGTQDDYEQDEHACDTLVASWPRAAREATTVHYFEGATHGFDIQGRPRQFNDEFAQGGRGGMVRMSASPQDASEARAAVVAFFVKRLNP